MKYTMVKQFSNASIDNVFKFFFKIVDLGKLLVEVFWGIFDIFAAFYLIFFNIFMYVYYLFLYMLDKGSESSGATAYKAKRSAGGFKSKIPGVTITAGPNPIPAMYRSRGVASKISQRETPQAKGPVKFSSPRGGGAKPNLLKKSLEFMVEFFASLKRVIAKPFIIVKDFFAEKLKPVKETGTVEKEKSQKTARPKTQKPSGTSLIDEYMKEYNRGKK